MKKRLVSIILAVVLAISVLPVNALAADQIGMGLLSVQYGQTEARTMLDMINDFRTGNEAWYWNSTNTEQVKVEGLQPLKYDYELEKTAMLRAAEIAVLWDHYRPNSEKCYSAYPDGYSYNGENIAAGTGSYGVASAFTSWQETDEDYSGQGHRRNMLNEYFTSVGIGHAYVNGVHFWTQEFSRSSYDTAETSANDTVTIVTIEYDLTRYSTAINGLDASYTGDAGDVIDLPELTQTISPLSEDDMIFDRYGTNQLTMGFVPEWSVEDTSIASVSDGVLTLNKAGTTTLTASGNGFTETATITVNGTEEPAIQFAIAGANMTLGNELSMNFFVKKADIDTSKDYYITIRKTYADGREDANITYPFFEWESYDSTYYSVKFNNLAAKEMNDAIYVQVFYANGTAATDVWEDSVAKYALRIFDKQNAKTKAMLADMLNYGSAAQTFFGYDADNLANSVLFAEQLSYATASVTATDGRIKGENYYGSNLNLGSNLQLSMFFKNLSSDMYAVIAFTNHYGTEETYRIEGSDFEVYSSANAIYRIYIDQIVVADSRRPVTCTVYTADGT